MNNRKELVFLIVEAGQTGLSTRKMVLETAGYNVLSTVTAEQALRFAEKYPVDVVLLDVDVHDIDGPEFIRRLRVRVPRLPVFLLASHPWPPEDLSGMVDGVFEKMEDPAAMVEQLGRHVEERAA